jgi:hypothetical protein
MTLFDVLYAEAVKSTELAVRFVEPVTPERRFTTSMTRLSTTVGVFDVSVPSMRVDLPLMTGGLSEKACEIILPWDPGAYSDLISSGQPVPPTKVYVYEVARWDQGLTMVQIYTGWLSRAEREREVDDVHIEVVNDKMYLQGTVGVTVDDECKFVLGGRGCQKDLTGTTETLRLNTIDGATVTTAALSVSRPEHHFSRGYLEYQGLRIDIRLWDHVTPRTFHLVRPPPFGWLGETVVAHAGCLHTRTVCDTLHANLDNFGGGGTAMPNYNPIIDSGPLG